ncbi:DUF1275 family protein [Streptomyces sp. NPDC002573]|uniref:DUF1275 family protein n=1 Tax=Streptomyces sp. NPDC002573 TaxID=3364651 RepID=UPI0036B37201
MADDRPGSADDPGASSSLTTDAFRAVLGGPDHDRLPVLLLTLTMLSGVIDATSVIDLGHVFVANMTGNLVFIGIGLLATPDSRSPRRWSRSAASSSGSRAAACSRLGGQGG